MLRTMKRNKTTVYLAKRIVGSNPARYNETIPISINFTVLRSEADKITFGENYLRMAKSNADIKEGVVFSELDKVYLNEPEVYDVLADKADYIITNVIPSINGYEILYEKLS